MTESQNSPAIIIRRNDWRENDSRVVLYTRNLGKLSLVARGIKKPGSKLAGHIEPIGLADIMILKGKTLDYLGSAITKEAYLNIKSDLNALYFTGAALALFDQLVKENVPDWDLFDFLESWLSGLNQRVLSGLNKENGELLYNYFVLRLFSILGYQPELYHCLECRRQVDSNGNYFNFRFSGLICPDCLVINQSKYQPNEIVPISADCIKLLRIFGESKQYYSLKVKPALVRELSRLVKVLIAFN